MNLAADVLQPAKKGPKPHEAATAAEWRQTGLIDREEEGDHQARTAKSSTCVRVRCWVHINSYIDVYFIKQSES